MLRSEDGSGPISAVFGVAIFLGFLLFATQTLVHLYATSTVTTAAFDAARRGAAEGGGGCADAAARVRALLGDYGQRAAVACDQGPDQVQVTVTAPSPANLLAGFGTGLGLSDIERTAAVRVEQLR